MVCLEMPSSSLILFFMTCTRFELTPPLMAPPLGFRV